MGDHHVSKIDLTTFFLSISSAALMSLGVDEEEGTAVDLTLAKQNIDLLELLEEKTKGNRTPEEDALIEKLLFEVRMRYVDSQKK